MKKTTAAVAGVCLMLLGFGRAIGQTTPTANEFSASSYRSIQEAIDANPGRMIHVPAGDYEIADKIRIHADYSGLCGPGRIIQTKRDAPIIEIERASGVQLRGLTLTRQEASMDTSTEAVLAIQCHNLVLESLHVRDNRTRSGAIAIRNCVGTRIRNCSVLNYMRISIDDRTGSKDWGYAFLCIDGSGIVVTESKGTLIPGNRVIEQNLLPSPEIPQDWDLG